MNIKRFGAKLRYSSYMNECKNNEPQIGTTALAICDCGHCYPKAIDQKDLLEKVTRGLLYVQSLDK